MNIFLELDCVKMKTFFGVVLNQENLDNET